ncbi:YccF domain-containing protein [Desulfovibrio sp. TomC]|uniref:YccF domain-containing protein n=1 Tax=Desulfovibrio sp. TomC TaxID=1562888 RepID=UPI0005735DE0|nr:YccF domain-containing protein [Desulfovibrio sp. TomC]KHK04560.1 hypothetical protein NY78_0341 [Desulfovibrio sp. TomC]
MQPVNFLMNILWLLLGGFWLAIGWYLAGVVMAITIIGLPWTRACFVLGNLSLWPFGKEVVDRRDVTGHDIGTGTLGFIGNVIWFVLAGVWLAIGHLLAAVANFVTIIGIPFALQHLKLAGLALAPIGKTVIDKRY